MVVVKIKSQTLNLRNTIHDEIFNKEELTIGRAEENDISFTSRLSYISRKHGKLKILSKGLLGKKKFIEYKDTSSSGTIVFYEDEAGFPKFERLHGDTISGYNKMTLLIMGNSSESGVVIQVF